ncbi:MAG: DUF883 domain-containing protein [Pseudomonadota bacterium]|nr:DUF883 domain-containing protein [Pseudomonadota bacterium]
MDKTQELQHLTDDVHGLLGKVANDRSPQVEQLRARVGETIQNTKTALENANNAALDAIKNAASAADDYVRDNPWVAVGVIAGVAASLGFLAGYVAAPQRTLKRSLMGMIRR